MLVWVPSSLQGQIYKDNLFLRANQVEIPFNFVNGFIILDVTYGDKLPLKFIFDTVLLPCDFVIVEKG